MRTLISRPAAAVMLVGALTLVLCLLEAQVLPTVPQIQDEFSYLLAADTYSQGRLTNPTHPLWPYFETPHVLQQPSYQSKYQPGQGLALALGQVLTGSPLLGVWLSLALACAAVCWMLQAWLPARWALLGGLLAATNGAFLHQWGATFMGGAVAMLGGALMFGALARSLKDPRPRNGGVLAIGALILAATRPFEGLVASLPTAAMLLMWVVRQRQFPRRLVRWRLLAPMTAVLALGACWLGYYNYRVTGSPFRLPYQVYLSQHENDIFTHPLAEELGEERLAEVRRPFHERLSRQGAFHLGGSLLFALPLLVAAPRLVKERWARFALLTSALTLVAASLTLGAAPHYSAPIAALLIGLLAQSLEVIGGWLRGRLVAIAAVGGFLAAWLLASYIYVDSAADLAVEQLAESHLAAPPSTPVPSIADPDSMPERQYWRWFASTGMPARQAHLERFGRDDDRHLILVGYVAGSTRYREWVYNRADIDAADTVWALWSSHQPLWPLLTYFNDRRVWFVVPERDPWEVLPFPRDEVGLWYLRQHADAGASLLPTYTATDPVRVEISAAGSMPWHLQLERAHPKVEQGRTYSIAFRARADAPRGIAVGVSRAHPPWRNLGLQQSLLLDSEWREFRYSFRANATDPIPRLVFDLGSSDAGVDLSGIMLTDEP